MIIECINCNKKFEVNEDLIPISGRAIKCGSCGHDWFYKKKEDTNNQTLASQIKRKEQNVPTIQIPRETENIIKEAEKSNVFIDYKAKKNNKTLLNKEKNFISNFFSYLVVGIISFIALIIFLDTLKHPLTKIFPSLEIFLFNLYETLKDIELFIIDLI